MIDGKTVLAIIPARGGSKGLPRKNVLDLGGRPLIAHSIEQALASKLVDRVVCSTDDSEIAEVAARFGCEVPFMRSAALAGDETETIEVIRDLCRRVDRADYLVLLQVTSPMRNVSDIDATIRLCHEKGAPVAVSVCESSKHPDWMYTLGPDGAMRPVSGRGPSRTKRQDLPAVYVLNGAVYVMRWENIEANEPILMPGALAHVMPMERSVDIDSAFDLEFVRFLHDS